MSQPLDIAVMEKMRPAESSRPAAANPSSQKGAAGSPARRQQLWQAVRAQPHGHDLFQLLRWLDALSGQRPLGTASRPREEGLRIGQEPSLAFAPGEIHEVLDDHGQPRLSVLGFGLFGPNGPLPLHLTEYVRERKTHYKDPTFCAFVDIFHHRLMLLFYRAWAQAQAVVSLDRGEQRFAYYLQCLLHEGGTALQGRNALAGHAKLAVTGHLARQTRNVEGLVQILRGYFGVPVALEENIETWVELQAHDQMCVSRHGSRLGDGQLMGRALREAQSRFRIVLGPLDLPRYRDFLPGADASRELCDWVRQYVGFEFAWELRLVLHREAVEGIRIGSQTHLGYGSWLGRRHEGGEADDLLYEPERYWQGKDSNAHSLESSR